MSQLLPNPPKVVNVNSTVGNLYTKDNEVYCACFVHPFKPNIGVVNLRTKERMWVNEDELKEQYTLINLAISLED